MLPDRRDLEHPHAPDRRTAAAVEAITAALAFAFLAAVLFGTSRLPPLHGARAVAAALLFVVLVGAYLALEVGAVVRALRAFAERRSRIGEGGALLLGPAVLWLAVVAYAALAGLEVGVRAAAFAAYLVVPTLTLAVGPRGDERGAAAAWPERVPVRELIAIALFWLPVELRLLPTLPVPAPRGHDASRFVGLVAALFLFLVARPLPGVGYTFALRRREVALAVAAFLCYAVVALPIGFATGFIGWAPRLSVAQVTATPVLIYLATAVPEELLFRGLIQNLLARWVGAGRALAVASVVFGLAHLPDPRYVLLAAIAGAAYGWVYLRTGRITAAAVTHALVDAVWVVLLRR